MKVLVDFENDGPLSKSIALIFKADSTTAVNEADLVLTDSVDKVLRYLQQTEKRVVQICHSHKYPMTHLIEDYPNRFRVADIRRVESVLTPVLTAISEIVKK